MQDCMYDLKCVKCDLELRSGQEAMSQFHLAQWWSLNQIQSGAVKTWSDIMWYFTHHCIDWRRIEIRVDTHKILPSYGVFHVKILEKIDHVIIAGHCLFLAECTSASRGQDSAEHSTTATSDSDCTSGGGIVSANAWPCSEVCVVWSVNSLVFWKMSA